MIANGEMRTECLTARDRTRFATKLRLSTATTTAQLAALVTDLEVVLRAHEKVNPETIAVRFSAVGDGSLDIEASCAVTTTQWAEFASYRQALLLGCVEATRQATSSSRHESKRRPRRPRRRSRLVRFVASRESASIQSRGPHMVDHAMPRREPM